MERIDPFSLERPALLPCNIYPFIAGRDAASYAAARTSLKLCCLLHENLHMPGSLALQDPFVQALTVEVLPFVEAGHVKLDLRSSCASFSDLVKVKYVGAAPPEVRRMADLLNTKCAVALSFDAVGTATQYAAELFRATSALRERARSREVVQALERALVVLSERSETLTLEDAVALLSGTHLNGRFRAIAKLLYSVQGAKVTNSDPVIPLELWHAAFPSRGGASLPGTIQPRLVYGSDRQFSNEVVMDHFSIVAAHIDMLDARAILEFKREPMTERYIRELDEAIDEASNAIPGGASADDALTLARDRAELIRRAIRAKCEKERKQVGVESWILGAANEVGGAAADLVGIGPIKQALAALARRLARKSKSLAWLDYTSAPIVTHVSRFRQIVADQRADIGPCS